MKKLLKWLLKNLNLEKKKVYHDFSYLEVIMEGFLLGRKNMNVVQIGANDGKFNDPIHRFLLENRYSTKALLIEPQPEIIPFLEENYKMHPHIKIVEGAVGTNEGLVLFRIKPNLWPFFKPPYLNNAPNYRTSSGITSYDKQYVMNEAKKYLKIDLPLEQCIEKIHPKCKKLVFFIKESGFGNHIDFIQIDTEGADDDVIYACSIEKIKPLIINYECKHLTLEKNERLENYLKNNHYKVIRWCASDKIALLLDN